MTSKPAQVDGTEYHAPSTRTRGVWPALTGRTLRESTSTSGIARRGGLLFGEPLHHGSLVIAAPARRRLLLDAPVEQLTARLERAGPGNRHQVLEPNALASALDAALVMAFSWPSEARFEQGVAR